MMRIHQELRSNIKEIWGSDFPMWQFEQKHTSSYEDIRYAQSRNFSSPLRLKTQFCEWGLWLEVSLKKYVSGDY
jgi:hypothetical protein